MTGRFERGNARAGKLSGEQVVEMRQRYAEGWSQGRLARHFGVSVGQVGRIVRGEAWQELVAEPRGRWTPPPSEALTQQAEQSEAQLRENLFAETPPTCEGFTAEALTEPSPGLTKLTEEAGKFAAEEKIAEDLMEKLTGRRS